MAIILFLFIELSLQQQVNGSVFCGCYVSTLPCTTVITARHAVKQTDAQHKSNQTKPCISNTLMSLQYIK